MGPWDTKLGLHLTAASEATPNDMVKLPRSLNVTCEKWTERGDAVVGESCEDGGKPAAFGESERRNGAMVGGVSTALTSLCVLFFLVPGATSRGLTMLPG